MKSNVEDRLEGALRYGAIRGDESEKAILESQIVEAIDELRRLRRLEG